MLGQERKVLTSRPLFSPWTAGPGSLSKPPLLSAVALATSTFCKTPHLGCGNVSLCSSSCSWPCSSCSLLWSSRSSHCSICRCPISCWLALNFSCNSVSLASSASHCGSGGVQGNITTEGTLRGWPYSALCSLPPATFSAPLLLVQSPELIALYAKGPHQVVLNTPSVLSVSMLQVHPSLWHTIPTSLHCREHQFKPPRQLFLDLIYLPHQSRLNLDIIFLIFVFLTFIAHIRN